jgi:serine/threonine protein kinase
MEAEPRGTKRKAKIISTIFGQILENLSAAHNTGIILRDVKPENMILDPAAGKFKVGFDESRLPANHTCHVSFLKCCFAFADNVVWLTAEQPSLHLNTHTHTHTHTHTASHTCLDTS